MNAGETVFAQILEHLPRYEFDKFVEKYEGNHRVRRFPLLWSVPLPCLCPAYVPGRIVERSRELIIRLVKGHPVLELYLEARCRIMGMVFVPGW